MKREGCSFIPSRKSESDRLTASPGVSPKPATPTNTRSERLSEKSLRGELPGILGLRQGEGEGVYEDHTRPSHRHRIRPEEPQPFKGRGSWGRDVLSFACRVSQRICSSLTPCSHPPTPLCSPCADFSDTLLYHLSSLTGLYCWFFWRRAVLSSLWLQACSHRSSASPFPKTPALYSPAIPERWY